MRSYSFFWLYLAIGSRQPLRFSCGQQQTLSPKLPGGEQCLIVVILLLAGRFCWFGATEDLPHFPVYILPEHFASCALHSISTAAKCWCGASHHWAIMENIIHPDPLELLELPQHFVQGTFKALQSCDVKWVQIVAFCCNLTLMNAHGERKRENKTRFYLAQKKNNPKSRDLSALSVYFASELLDTNATMAHMLNFEEQSC